MPTVSDNLLRKLDEIALQHAELSAQLEDPAVLGDHRRIRAISIRRAALEALVRDYERYRAALRQVDELRGVIDHESDAEIVEMARGELPEAEQEAESLMGSIQKRLLTADEQAIGSVIMEVRAGVGGDEAAIWAGDLVAMYRQYASFRGWSLEEMQFSPGDAGGLKNAVFSISGPGVWSALGYEGGTHQVKRVPATEAQGRVHTSTATVAVLPEPEEVEVKIAREDVKEIMTTAQGPGGQNVNKVATAVHLIHIPTGLEVRMQETKSQAQNRERAWQLLRARLYERQKAAQEAQRAEHRSSMIGRATRAEKIRTYRWKENIVVDHRLSGPGSEKAFNLGEIMAGRMQPLIDALVEQDVSQRIAAL
jgi:peptide chain release factor 1